MVPTRTSFGTSVTGKYEGRIANAGYLENRWGDTEITRVVANITLFSQDAKGIVTLEHNKFILPFHPS